MTFREATAELLERFTGRRVDVSVRADVDQGADDVGFVSTLRGSSELGRVPAGDDVVLDFADGQAMLVLREDRFAGAEWRDIAAVDPAGDPLGSRGRLLQILERGRVVELSDV
jgi:hypothetical protein